MSWTFCCPRCGHISQGVDAKMGYCGKCHNFTRVALKVTGCLAPECERPVMERGVLCEAHWQAVPRELQRDFYRARYKFEQGIDGGEDLANQTVAKIERCINGG
jgi:hypothetical protein